MLFQSLTLILYIHIQFFHKWLFRLLRWENCMVQLGFEISSFHGRKVDLSKTIFVSLIYLTIRHFGKRNQHKRYTTKAYQSSFSTVKNDLICDTCEKCTGFRNKVCVFHLKAASLHSHEKKELFDLLRELGDLYTTPEKNPDIQRTVHTNSYCMSCLERKYLIMEIKLAE